jgi:hypothetical protein
MSCRGLRAYARDVALGLGPESLRRAALDHASRCERCARRLQDERALSAALARLASADEDEGTAETTLASLVARLGEARVPSGHRARRAGVPAAGLAAALLLAAGSRVSGPGADPVATRPAPARAPEVSEARAAAAPPVVRRADQRPPRATQGGSTKPAPPTAPGDGGGALAADDWPPVDETPATPGVSADQSTSDEHAGVGDDAGFLPLQPASDVQPEAGQVFRLRMPPAALAAVGLPAEPGTGGTVDAEVLVSQDGVARGIRLAPRRGSSPSALRVVPRRRGDPR